MWAFPGGKVDNLDKEQAEKKQKQYSLSSSLSETINKQCALRETFEETGLFVLKKNIFKIKGWEQLLVQTLKQYLEKVKEVRNQIKNLQVEIQQKEGIQLDDQTKKRKIPKIHHYTNEFYILEELFEQNFYSKIQDDDISDDNLFNLFRFITPSKERVPKRFDTRFFGIKINEQNAINWNQLINYVKNEKILSNSGIKKNILDFDTLRVSKGEVANFQWMTPSFALQEYFDEKIKMVFPQFIITNILSHFYDVQQIVDYRYTILAAAKKFQAQNFHIQHKKYSIEWNPLDFPLLVQFTLAIVVDPQQMQDITNTQKNCMSVVFPGDYNYPIQQLLQDEATSDTYFVDQVVNKYFSKENIQDWKNKKSKARIFYDNSQKLLNFSKKFESHVSLGFPSFLNFLSDYQDLQRNYKEKNQPKL
ncbi:NUDIX hydrolase domain protein [Pseudocohnilembus persalinus]|uniref:NUDIX hydrolase domain protein n=1 Tax=Pseudocohnilembus persalinus TaxID=266149 RepID=A0A0V0QFM4_PSEPJ|nr:NUDIX hydrolase domain protein [Pseudocohnilembus persalinus]|eukprot:KRX00996.1 NUDIX hydrolase domain protein [Pseudocohnilembus persalinus]